MPENRHYDAALDAAGEALGALGCPYYRGDGECREGCSQEPRCRVDEPTDGWAAALLEAAREIVRDGDPALGLDASICKRAVDEWADGERYTDPPITPFELGYNTALNELREWLNDR